MGIKFNKDEYKNLSNNCEVCEKCTVKAIQRRVNELPSMLSTFIVRFG
jgi:PHP family Zn ribbon phosphoesterase